MAQQEPGDRPVDDAQAGDTVSSDHSADLEHRRRALAEALARKPGPKGADDDPEKHDQAGSGFGAALKLSSEFIGGVLVGAGLGYLADEFAGTRPWGMIVFLLLGFAAGVLNVLRATGRVAEPRANGLRDPGRSTRERSDKSD
ncbi:MULTISPECIES: AtpZ/AtpI family protein [unclassified Roseitalea]|uniref:AtpZ/AtpI family protein n=1 Tax=unclassified Roseitalea TaxID=2639107 RepID=UPI00273DDCA7|nr:MULTISPECIES: AtpZ/AtpI family protein [unclassified Roseitalea]